MEPASTLRLLEPRIVTQVAFGDDRKAFLLQGRHRGFDVFDHDGHCRLAVWPHNQRIRLDDVHLGGQQGGASTAGRDSPGARLGGIVALEAVRVGSFDIDAAIQNYVRREQGIAIGERTAEEIRNQSLGILERMQEWREKRARESETSSC